MTVVVEAPHDGWIAFADHNGPSALTYAWVVDAYNAANRSRTETTVFGGRVYDKQTLGAVRDMLPRCGNQSPTYLCDQPGTHPLDNTWWCERCLSHAAPDDKENWT